MTNEHKDPSPVKAGRPPDMTKEHSREIVDRVVREWSREARSQSTAFNVPSVYLGSLVSDLMAEVPALSPVDGLGSEPVSIRIVREHQHYRFGVVDRNGKWTTSEIVRSSGQGAGNDFNAALERWLPALQPKEPT